MSSVASRPADEGLAAHAGEGKLVFGKYKVHRRIGRGGMGEVYLASLVGELGFEKQLVIKTILPELAAKPKFVEMFAAEAKTAVSLSHGNIVPIYELGRANDTLYIVMGYVDGPSVQRMLGAYRKRQVPPPVGIAVLLTREVLTGLAYAHTEGVGRPAVVHRDISPRNVLVDRSGQVRIVDFGIAVPAHVESAVRGGSTGYMAPEQARAERASPRADVFSTACLLYELLTLEKAFPNEGVWVAPDVSALPEAMRDVVARALSLDPADRPEDAGAFIAALGPAFAKHAATLTDTALAAHLRELFVDGWEEARADDSGGALTPVTNIAPKTFATRLTEITGSAQPLPRPIVEGATGNARADATRGDPAWRRTLVPAAALLALAAVALLLVRMLPTTQTPAPTPTTAVAPRPGPTPANVAPGPPPTATRPVAHPSSGAPMAAADGTPSPSAPDPLGAAWVTVDVQPTQAQVSVSGVPLAGASPYRIPVPEQGEVAVRVSAAGFVTQSFAVKAGSGHDQRTIRLLRAEPKGKGMLQVFSTSVSWAEVSVDGKRRGTTPMRKLSLAEGPHRVVVRCVPDVCPAARVLLDRTVTIKADETTKLTAQ